jgi:hypothetical protein
MGMYADVNLQDIKRVRIIFSAHEKTSVAYLLLPFKTTEFALLRQSGFEIESRLDRPLAGFFVLVP